MYVLVWLDFIRLLQLWSNVQNAHILVKLVSVSRPSVLDVMLLLIDNLVELLVLARLSILRMPLDFVSNVTVHVLLVPTVHNVLLVLLRRELSKTVINCVRALRHTTGMDRYVVHVITNVKLAKDQQLHVRVVLIILLECMDQMLVLVLINTMILEYQYVKHVTIVV